MDRSGTWKRISRNWGLYLLLLPALVLLILFAYKPMYGVVIAFKNYKNSLGILGSPWADPLFKNFQRFFNSYQCETTIRNTLRLSLYSLAVGFPIPIILALMINQITAMRFRRTFQTILYLPHFISTVVMVGLLLIWLSPSSGLVGAFYRLLGKDAPNVMTSASGFPSIYVWSDVWQHSGWDSIVFLAALSSIDPTLYEAATVDGASEGQKLIHVTAPMVRPVTFFVSITTLLESFKTFEQVKLMTGGDPLYSTTTIVHQIYQRGFTEFKMGYAAAMSVVLLLIVLIVTLINVRFGGRAE